MRLRKLAKDPGSGEEGCPSVYVDEDAGEMVVQGELADAETFNHLEHRLPGESAVRIRPEVIVAAAERYSVSSGEGRR